MVQTASRATGALVGSTALSLGGADVELIFVCAEFCNLEHAYDTAGRGLEDDSVDPERKTIVAKETDAIAARRRNACSAIIDSRPARTHEGIALKVAAAMQLLRVALYLNVANNWPGLGEEAAWHVLSKIVGNAYVPSKYPARFSLCDQEPPRRSASDRPFAQYPLGGADANLLAACAEFRASEAAYCAIYDDPNATDESAELIANPISAGWNGMLDQMAMLRATTNEGLAARAMALAQHSGIKPGTENYPFAFEPDDPKDMMGRLLDMLLRDAVLIIAGAPLLDPDADLITLRPEFDRLHALMIAYNKDLIPDGETECADFDACAIGSPRCRRPSRLRGARSKQLPCITCTTG